MLSKFWKYVSNNALLAALLAIYISTALGGMWASIIKPTRQWFWTDADVSIGGIVILVLAAGGTIVTLALALLRARADSAELEESGGSEGGQVGEFDLTVNRRRVLLVLLHDYGQPVNGDVLVQTAGEPYMHQPATAKARFTRDLEAA